MKRDIEIPMLGTLMVLVTVAAAALGRWLRVSVFPGTIQQDSLYIFLSVLVLFTSSIAFCLGIAFVFRIITRASGLEYGFWPKAAMFVQDFSLWLLIRWLFLWGVPFSIGMSLYFLLERYYSLWLSSFLGLIAAFIVLVFLRRILPRDVWQIASRFNVERQLGWKRGTLVFLVLTAVGYVHLHSCYVFDVSTSGTDLSQMETLQVTVKLSGRIWSHKDVVVQIKDLDRGVWISDQASFKMVEPGRYISWIPLSNLKPGVYRGLVSLHSGNDNGMWTLGESWLADRYIKRSFLFRVQQGKKRGAASSNLTD
jgi:hypothetical protein